MKYYETSVIHINDSREMTRIESERTRYFTDHEAFAQFRGNKSHYACFHIYTLRFDDAPASKETIAHSDCDQTRLRVSA